jgi:hypothetical protein
MVALLFSIRAVSPARAFRLLCIHGFPLFRGSPQAQPVDAVDSGTHNVSVPLDWHAAEDFAIAACLNSGCAETALGRK